MDRSVFQDGHVLRTADFVEDQAYHVARHRQHNIDEHRWGIAAGLALADQEGSLVVTPGRAVDGFGRDVVLDNAHTLDLSEQDLLGVEDVAIWLVYAQEREPGAGDAVDRLADSARVEVKTAGPVDPRMPPGVSAADLALGATAPPDDPGRRWPVYLGRINRDLTQPDRPPELVPDGRPYIGLVGATVESPAHGVWIDLGDTVDGTLSVRIQDANGNPRTPLKVDKDGVELSGPLTVGGDLVVRGGSLTVVPGGPALTGPAAAPEWSLSHAEDTVAHELRVTMPAAGGLPNQLVIGVWKDGAFVRSLAVDDAGTVLIAGNLVVGGHLQATSVLEAKLSDEAKAYLAGLKSGSLLALFSAVPPANH